MRCLSVAAALTTLGRFLLRTTAMLLSVLSIPALLICLALVIAKHALRNLSATLESAGE